MTTLAVIAKECLPGRVKTRLAADLAPLLTPTSVSEAEEWAPDARALAARIASAALDDTLAATASAGFTRRILFFDGDRPPDSAHGYEIVPQPSGSLDIRIAALFDLCEGPAVLLGMDTPQLTAADADHLARGWDTDALFGPAADGGFWTLGLREPRGDLVRGVPMSRPDTGAVQRARLLAAGLSLTEVRTLRDIDHLEDLAEVVRHIPDSSIARCFEREMKGAGTSMTSGRPQPSPHTSLPGGHA